MPEPAAHRQVRARFERLRPEAGEQRKCRDHACLFLGGKARELVEVGQVARSPAAGRVERKERNEDPERTPVLAKAAAGTASRCDDHRRGADPPSHADAEGVIAALQERRERYGSPVDVPAVAPFPGQGHEIVAVYAPPEPLTVLGFDRALQVGVGLTQSDENIADRRVVDDGHRFHDPLDASAATAPKQPGCIGGPPDRHTESVQYREDDFGFSTPTDAGRVQVLEHDARISGEGPQPGGDLRTLRHGSVRPGDEAGDERIGECRVARQHAGDEDRVDTGFARNLHAVVDAAVASSFELGGYRVRLVMNRCDPELHGDVLWFQGTEVRHDLGVHCAAWGNGDRRDGDPDGRPLGGKPFE